LGEAVDPLDHVELLCFHSCFGVHIAADCLEDAREDTVEETKAEARHCPQRYLLCHCLEVRKRRIHNDQVVL
jgi:hypothetical protein